MEHINVRGLPEPVVRALENMVEALRKQWMSAPPKAGPSNNGALRLEHRPGKVIGRLSREELYDDVA